MSESMIIDAVVIALLSATIYFAFRLDRRLEGMRNVQNELAAVIRELNIAASRAEAGIQGLKVTAESTGQRLEEKIRDARGAGDELAILLKATDRAARSIEPRVRQEPVIETPKARPAAAVSMPAPAPLPRQAAAPAPVRAPAPSALEALRALRPTG